MPALALVASDLIRGALRGAAFLGLAFVVASALAGASLAALTQVATGRGPDVPDAAAAPVVPSGEPTGAAIVALARLYLGMPYVWGGADPTTSFDCSGLVQWVHARAGVHLPRTAQQQHDATARIPTADLRPGDLLFFANTYNTYATSPAEPITHVGIYVGGGRMVNAPREGDVVREMDAFTGFWGAHYAGGGRVGGLP
jgi:cell wall-associated NlpC family hydrolase